MKNLRLLVLVVTSCLSISHQVGAEEKNNSTLEQDLVEQTPRDFQPAFTKDTVIKLNSIVARSLEIISEYDAIIQEVKSVAESTTTKQSIVLAKHEIARIDALSKRSKRVLSDMNGAVKRLEESEENYNTVILAGMVGFVEDVEEEISSQTKILMSTLDKP